MKFDVWVSLVRGKLAALFKQMKIAELSYRNALAADPSCLQAANNLGLIYGQRGDSTLAMGYFEQVLRIDPNNITALYNVAYIQHHSGKPALAKATFKKLLNVESKLDIAWFGLAMIYAEENRHDLAREALEKAVDAAPENPHVWYALGMANHVLDEKQNVKTIIAKLRRFNPRIAMLLERDTAVKKQSSPAH
ncbi:MAG: tetratricopeptide repeat protein [Burkholderiales bacterium]|nr:tetratricopeptide repeat protein [Burkholderiales bacterium]